MVTVSKYVNPGVVAARTDCGSGSTRNIYTRRTSSSIRVDQVTSVTADWVSNSTTDGWYTVPLTATANAATWRLRVNAHNTSGWRVHTSTCNTDVWDDNDYSTGTITINTNETASYWNYEPQVFTLEEMKRQLRHAELQKRLRPNVINHRGQPARSAERGRQFDNAQPEELVALQLLRRMVTPEEFRRYLRHGFVHVRGPSGLVYQVGRNQTIKVWDRNELIASLCVHLRDRNIPPTDEVVAKMLIVECDEPDIWKRSNITWRTHRDRAALHALGYGAAARHRPGEILRDANGRLIEEAFTPAAGVAA